MTSLAVEEYKNKFVSVRQIETLAE